MADVKQTDIPCEVILKAVEQKIASGNAYTGVAPSLAGQPFAPYVDSVDGIVRMKQDGTPANDEADLAGLFEFAHEQPIAIEQVFADFSLSTNWAVSIVTSNGDFQVLSGTSQLIQHYGHDKAFVLMPGEKLKVTSLTNGTGVGWVRVYVKLVQHG